MKKFILISLVSALILQLVGCGSNYDSEIESSAESENTQDISETITEEASQIESTSEIIDLNETHNKEKAELVQYTINEIDFSIPEKWKLLEESDTSITFQVSDNDRDRLIVKSGEIPDIMKVDVGKDSISDKSDVVDCYGVFGDVTKMEWLKNYEFECCNVYFIRENDTRKGRSITIPINETDAYFTALAMTENESDLSCVDVVIQSIDIEDLEKIIENKNEISETEKYYNNAINISPDDCIKMNENSIAYDFSIVLTDYEGHPLKDKNALERSTLFLSLYYGMAACALSEVQADYTDYVMPHITNKTFDTQSDLISYVSDCLTWMTHSHFSEKMIEKFNTMKNVSIKNDNSIYVCTIPDVKKCADELNISEEMFGYVIAALEDCGTTTKFNGNQCEIEYNDYDNRINLS